MTREVLQILISFSVGFAGAFAFRYTIYPVARYFWRRVPQQLFDSRQR